MGAIAAMLIPMAAMSIAFPVGQSLWDWLTGKKELEDLQMDFQRMLASRQEEAKQRLAGEERGREYSEKEHLERLQGLMMAARRATSSENIWAAVRAREAAENPSSPKTMDQVRPIHTGEIAKKLGAHPVEIARAMEPNGGMGDIRSIIERTRRLRGTLGSGVSTGAEAVEPEVLA